MWVELVHPSHETWHCYNSNGSNEQEQETNSNWFNEQEQETHNDWFNEQEPYTGTLSNKLMTLEHWGNCMITPEQIVIRPQKKLNCCSLNTEEKTVGDDRCLVASCYIYTVGRLERNYFIKPHGTTYKCVVCYATL